MTGAFTGAVEVAAAARAAHTPGIRQYQEGGAMLGAIVGDVIGSVYEGRPTKRLDFDLFPPGARFTDDTVLTVALADSILNDADYAECMRDYARKYPNAGYGKAFLLWMQKAGGPYTSHWNGSAMRVSPVGLAFDSVDAVLAEAERSAVVSHDHPEAIQGAQATALAVFMARSGESKDALRSEIAGRFGYDLDRTVEGIRPEYAFDVTCQGSVPEAIICFLDSHDYESAVRNAVSLGGDADTQAAIAGAIAAQHYGAIPPELVTRTNAVLPAEFIDVVDAFHKRYS